jgi:starvation-inducible DNA-binding protein
MNDRQNNMLNLLNQYLSNIKVLHNKLCNFHWNVVGVDFFTLHEELRKMEEKTSTIFDEIAERIKQLNGYPITLLKEYSEASQIKDESSKDYALEEIGKILINDYSYMIAISSQIITFANSINDYTTSSLMQKNITFYEKIIWMLRSNIK